MSIVEKVMQAAVRLTPESLLPGGKPDPLLGAERELGKPVSRVDGMLKVTDQARFAAEVPRVSHRRRPHLDRAAGGAWR